jgi:serine/threonine protein kinase
VGGRYLLLRVVGEGGMGVVWAARDQTLDRMVAVKEVAAPPQLGDSERQQAQQRVLREARAAGGVASVAAVSVYDVLAEDGQSWIVMELLEGPTLADVIHESGPLSVTETIAIGESIVDALEMAHRAGVLHRDVKPTNVLLTKRGAVLTDFGIAHREGDPGITTTGVVFGSPSYLAPERARGEPAGRPADLWALGATLYAASEGRGPFDRSGQLAALHAVINEPVPPPQRAGALAPLLMRLLSKDPAQRPTVDETQQLLSLASRGQPAATVPITVGGEAAAATLPPPAWTTSAPRPADDPPAQVIKPVAKVDEPSRPSQPRRRPGRRLVVTGSVLLSATLLAFTLATVLPDLGGSDGGATNAVPGPSTAGGSDSTEPSSVPTAASTSDATSDPDADISSGPTADSSNEPPDSGAGVTSAPAPFQQQALYHFARYLFDPRECFVPSPGQFPVSELLPDTELVKCISTSVPYTGTFWCKSELDDLLADRDVYLARATNGTQPVVGPPAGRTTSEDGIQVAFNHTGGGDARVYWDSEKRLCAGELQTAGSDDVDATVAYWLNGSA